MRRFTLALAGGPLLIYSVAWSGLIGSGFQGPQLTALHFKAPEFPSAVPEFNQPGSPGALPPTAGPGGGRPGGFGTPSGVPRSETEPPVPVAPPVTWINSSPLAMAGLHGKVVLIDFWEYTCINCIRTFSQNKKWYERYHGHGFQIIGVHDPEFDVAYQVGNVREAVKRFGLPYPIVVDNEFRIWNSYHNSTWPNRFLIDAEGYVRFNRSGEGADAAFEAAIQALLREAHPGLKFPDNYTLPPEEDAFSPKCGIPTAEMYVGDWHNRGILGNPEGYHGGKTLDYSIHGEVKDGQSWVAGRWETDANGMIYRGKNRHGRPGEDRLEMRYHAREIYAVMNASRGKPSRLYIQQDGKDLAGQEKGVDVQFDENGHSYVEVRKPRMYYLAQNPSFGEHKLALFPTAPGLTINSFTFGNNCQTQFPHL